MDKSKVRRFLWPTVYIQSLNHNNSYSDECRQNSKGLLQGHFARAVNWMQARREGGVGGLATPGPATFGGPTVGQKYKVRQSVPFWKEKFKNSS